jgi:glycosyltransferase involved in cell wall biosynthesis
LDTVDKIKVIHFQRRPRPGFNFSIEGIFEDLRCRLKDKVNFSVKLSGRFNDGYFSKFWNITEAGFRQKKNAISHITGEVNFLDLLMRKENVLLTIHDCRYVERKKGMARKLVQWLYLQAPVQKARYITTVSENTKRDVIRYTGCAPEKIKVIPDNVKPVFEPVVKTFNKDCPVILQIGAAENKNVSCLAEALKGIECRLVIVGNPDNNTLEQLQRNQINYVIKQNLSTGALYQEYADCDIVSFVSTYEGFGMPIIEGNCVERVVITSNISSMPEVAGDAACLVDPFDVEDIRNGFLRIIRDDDYREQLIVNGSRNKLRFDGGVIAEAYYAVYKEMSEAW